MKKQVPITLYFALSLFAILNSELLVTMKAAYMPGVLQPHVIYALYSFCVTGGVAGFYFFHRKFGKTNYTGAAGFCFYAIYPAAALSALLLAHSGTPMQFYIGVVVLFLLAGMHTGVVSLRLYQLFQDYRYIGRVLACASLLGIGGHYLLAMLAKEGIIDALLWATISAIAILFLLMYRILGKQTIDFTQSLPDIEAEGHENHVPLLAASGITIIGISFLIGISDSIAAQQMPPHITAAPFIYPMLFYIPGQVLACLLLDVKRGRYLHLVTLFSVVALIPITLFLEEPHEFYLNAGSNYFLGGFFLVYIMTAMISVAHKTKRPLQVTLLPGMLYSLFCAVGGLLSPAISRNMSSYMILFGYSLIIICLLSAMNISETLLRRANESRLQKQIATNSGSAANIGALAREYRLTNREREVLPLLLSAMTADEIAAALHISANTVKTHIRNILGKTSVSSRRELRQKLR